MTNAIGRPLLEISTKEQEEILEWVSEGRGLFSWSRNNGHSYYAVCSWVDRNPEFAKGLARAREIGAEALLEEAEKIADDESQDFYLAADGQKPNNVKVARAKLRIDDRRWRASKLNPARYSDKIGIGGAEGLPSLPTVLQVMPVAAKNPTGSDT